MMCATRSHTQLAVDVPCALRPRPRENVEDLLKIDLLISGELSQDAATTIATPVPSARSPILVLPLTSKLDI